MSTADDLRRRRRELWQELTRLDMELDADGAADPELESWISQTARAPQIFALLDTQSRILSVNRVPAGRPDPIGRSVLDFVPEERRNALRDAIGAALDSGRPQYVEGEGHGPLGESSWYSTWVVPMTGPARTTMAVVSADVTQARRIEEALASEKSLFESLVAHAPDTVMVVGRDFRVQFINRTQAPRTLDDVMGKPADSLVAEEHQHLVREAMQSVFATGEPTAYETRVQLDDGARWYSVRVGPVIEDGEVNRVSLVATDITERKQAEEERSRLITELAQAQKMQAIGQLTGGVAHDFNNLLTVIMSSLEMIELAPDDQGRVLGHARQALGASERAAALTQQLLAFARRQPLRPRVVNLNDLVRNAESLLRRTLGERVIIDTVADPDLWPCETDPAQLENAILNLAINARDAMPGGGHLGIETANVQISPEDRALRPNVEPGDYVMLRVTDDGMGMAPEIVRHAFEPFFTTKDAGQGSGLGLSMVYGFVRQSGGHVQIESEPGHGTAVRIHLPRGAGTADDISHQTQPATTPIGRGELVLVVEDDPSVRSLVVQSLEGLGYRVREADDAGSALDALSEAGDLPVEVVLTDVVLPGGRNGPALAREIAARHPGLPVLYMSGYSTDALSGDGRLDPNHTLLEKPFSRQRLAIAVRDALDGSPP